MVRKQVLNSSQCDHGLSLKLCDSMKNVEDESDIYGSSDAIVLVQSVMRGFLTRQMTLQDLKRLDWQMMVIIMFPAILLGGLGF